MSEEQAKSIAVGMLGSLSKIDDNKAKAIFFNFLDKTHKLKKLGYEANLKANEEDEDDDFSARPTYDMIAYFIYCSEIPNIIQPIHQDADKSVIMNKMIELLKETELEIQEASK